MDLPSQTIINVLTFLLPGFVTAALLYSLTPRPRPVPFERVVQALIFTVVIQAAVSTVESSVIALGAQVGSIGTWTKNTQIIWSIALAVVMAGVLAWLDNYDRLHTLWRRLGITHQTSFPSEWFGTLSQHSGYIVLHLSGNRRLYGWPAEWPNQPDQGHFVMAEAEWLLDTVDSEGRTTIPLTGVQRVLIPAKDVEMVELMEPVARGQSTAATGDTDGRSKTPEPSAE